MCNCTLRENRALFGVFIVPTRKAHLFVLDRVRTNQMPNMTSLYRNERAERLTKIDNYPAPPDDFTFDLRVDTEIRRVSLDNVLSVHIIIMWYLDTDDPLPYYHQYCFFFVPSITSL